MVDVSKCFDAVLPLVKSAGEIVLEGFDSIKHYQTKATSWDLVTEYDKRVEITLISQIQKHFPTHKFIGEETSNDEVLTNDPTWIIDPIDGTLNYVHRFPHSCISVAFAVDKELVIGIVYNPMMDQLFTAQKGKGAFLNGKPISTTKTKELSQSLIALEISLAKGPEQDIELFKRTEACIKAARGVRSIGSAELTLCYVAMGALDAYTVDFLYCWDVAAGVCIIREAGGVAYETSGKKFDVMTRRVLTAATEEIAQELIALIKKSDANCNADNIRANGKPIGNKTNGTHQNGTQTVQV
uniref:Inositol-1-monophosphatase n=1 Tax=Cacopsylla melanoneura TaxID=428564 RepID=A0A8D9EPW3_9HEMI